MPKPSKHKFARKVSSSKREQLLKKKRVIAKIPKSVYSKIKNELKKKYELKSYQELYDYLIVSGICFFDKEILKIVDENIDFYIQRDKKAKLARLGECEMPEYEDYHQTNFYMYEKDYVAFKDYVVEKNVAQQWVFEILFSAFAEENDYIISLIQKAKHLDVRRRKKQIARLVEDKWIKMLPPEESKAILEQLTENYDNRTFDTLLQDEIDKVLDGKFSKMGEEEELERELNQKIEEMRRSRAYAVSKLSKPREAGEADGG